jgi:methylmalonyl-CoA/ethylmalonyl-CoA epimerase
MESKWQFTHVSVVVRDMEKAVKYYESLGIGPFEQTLGGASKVYREVHGKPAPDVKNIEMMAQMGPIRFALVQPIAGESVQKEFLQRHGEGIDHIGFRVDDLEGETSKLTQRGFKVVSSIRVGDGGLNFLDTDKVGGVMIELMQPPSKK